jgi:hypothetical protein
MRPNQSPPIRRSYLARLGSIDGADAKRTKKVGGEQEIRGQEGRWGDSIGFHAALSGLRLAIRFLAGASRRAIKRLQRTVAHASKLACPPAADPQLCWMNDSDTEPQFVQGVNRDARFPTEEAGLAE